MSEHLFDQVEKLYECGLYSNVVYVGNLITTYCDQNPEYMQPNLKLQLLTYYADSLFQQQQYRKGEIAHRRVLQLKKSVAKSKTSTAKTASTPETKDVVVTSDHSISVKYNLHRCLLKMGDKPKALLVLQSIPSRNRTPSVNLALAKLFQENGSTRSAIYSYKEVLKACPLAFEAAEALLKMNERGAEVSSLILNGISNIPNIDWLISWIKARALFYTRQYQAAIALLISLDYPGILSSNTLLFVMIGECYFNMYDYKTAIVYLQRVFTLDPTMQSGLDLLVASLVKVKRLKELDVIISTNIPQSEYQAENWYVLASYTFYVLGKNAKAIYFAQKACLMDAHNVEALLLKALILFDMKKYQEAMLHYREILQINPNCFDAHRGMVNCFLVTYRNREAASAAANACVTDPNVRTYMLYARVLSLTKDPVLFYKAKTYIIKALSLDKTYLPAVYYLAEIYERDNNITAAIELLENQLKMQNTSRLHQLLGSLYAKETRKQDKDKAMEHFTVAIKMDPENKRAIEGLHSIDNNSAAHKGKMDSAGRCCVTTDPIISGTHRNDNGELLATPVASNLSRANESTDVDFAIETPAADRTNALATSASDHDVDVDDNDEQLGWVMDLDFDDL